MSRQTSAPQAGVPSVLRPADQLASGQCPVRPGTALQGHMYTELRLQFTTLQSPPTPPPAEQAGRGWERGAEAEAGGGEPAHSPHSVRNSVCKYMAV